jgi:hypothetical protein
MNTANSPKDFSTAKLGPFRLDIDLARGGKVTGLYRDGLDRNILFAVPDPFAVTEPDGAVFTVEGWDECVPTVAASLGAPNWGWAWRTHPDMTFSEGAVGMNWRMPGLMLRRELSLLSDLLLSRYEITNTGTDPQTVLWATHLLFPVAGLTRVTLPGGGPAPGPQCDLDDLLTQLREDQPDGWYLDSFSDTRESWKFFVPADVGAMLFYKDSAVNLLTPEPWFGVFLNRGRFGKPCIGIEPTNGPSDCSEEQGVSLAPGASAAYSWMLSVVVLDHENREPRVGAAAPFMQQQNARRPPL